MSNLSELLPTGGGQNAVDFVASGTLSSGQTVILRSDGKVEAVAETNISESVGSKTTIEASETEDFGAAYDIANNKVVVSYTDRDNSDYGTYAVGTISGTSISFGTPGVFQSAATTNNSLVYDPDTGQIIFVSVSGGASGKSVVGTVSGTSISFGTSATYEANPVYWLGATYVTDQQKVFIAYRRTNNNIGYGVVGTVSGTSISFGSPVQFSANRADHVRTTYAGSSKVVVVYEDFGNNQKGAAIVGTISGTSVSFGTQSFYDSSFPCQYNNIAYDPVNDKVLVIYYRTYGKGVVGTISGTSISFGGDFDFDQTNVVRYGLGIVYSALTGTFVIVYPDASSSNEGYYVQGTISGTDVSFTSRTQLTTTEFDWCVVTIDNTTAKPIVAWSDDSSGYATSLVIQLAYTSSNSADFIGITAEAISDTATGAVNVYGGINEAQTGLTIGSDYYVQDDGSLAAGATSIPFDISSATATTAFTISQDSVPTGIAFNTSGSKMFICGRTNSSVFQYSLSSAFDVSTASYDSVSFSFSAQQTTAAGMAFNADGTSMYVLSYAAATVYQYTLSVGFDLTTASYASKSFSVSSQEGEPHGIAFNTSGTKLYIVGVNNDTVYQYSLSSAFDVSTASYDSVSFSIGSQEAIPLGLTFGDSGNKMYVIGTNGDDINEYSLSSAFDISTSSFTLSFSVAGEESDPRQMVFNTDGTKMFVVGSGSDEVNQYATTQTAFVTAVKVGQAISATTINMMDLT